MASNVTRRRWTYAEFSRLPTSGSVRYEVIDDELVVTPSPSALHQWIVARLLSRLLVFVEANELGQVFPAPLDVLFAEGDYVQPDIIFVRRDRAHIVTERGIEGPPDLVVEVLSPSTAARDRGIKLRRFRYFGVPEYWAVDPDERAIEVWTLAEGAADPVVYGPGQLLRWTPPPQGPTLDIDPRELFES